MFQFLLVALPLELGALHPDSIYKELKFVFFEDLFEQPEAVSGQHLQRVQNCFLRRPIKKTKSSVRTVFTESPFAWPIQILG